PSYSLYSDVDQRNLHSFPTRRSSDLDPNRKRLVAAKDRLPRSSTSAIPRTQSGRHRWRKTGLPRPNVALTRKKRRSSCNGIRTRDRKSTRLNSSHRTISYAVFCLKKK